MQDVLERFQNRHFSAGSGHIRLRIDEIQDSATPTIIVLKYLEDDLLSADIRKPLNRKKIKYVMRAILEALSVLHEDGNVHTDVRPSNVFANYRKGDDSMRFSDVQLGYSGGSYHQNSKWAKVRPHPSGRPGADLEHPGGFHGDTVEHGDRLVVFWCSCKNIHWHAGFLEMMSTTQSVP